VNASNQGNMTSSAYVKALVMASRNIFSVVLIFISPANLS